MKMIFLALVSFAATPALGGAPVVYSTTWSTPMSGGVSTGGVYTMRSVVGQPTISVATGGVYMMSSGVTPLSTPPVPTCPGDADGDMTVDFVDLNLLLGHWSETVPAGTLGDVSGDGVVTFEDLNLVLGAWGDEC